MPSIHSVLLTLRWTARILGTAILILIASLAIGEGLPNPLAQPLAVNLLFAAMVTMMIGGLLTLLSRHTPAIYPDLKRAW